MTKIEETTKLVENEPKLEDIAIKSLIQSEVNKKRGNRFNEHWLKT